jgi:predicted aldo/keto reductase-like oxidoreductase
LGTDYIDLWQFHGVSTFENLDRVLGPGGAMEAAQSAKLAGKIRHIGITSHSMDVALRATASGRFETVQFPFNVITCEPADELVPLAREHDVGFIAMKPLAGGMLDNVAIAFKYLLQFDNVVPDPGIERTAEIDEILAITRADRDLTAADVQEIERMRAELGTRFCRRCQYCIPCPEGIPIPTVMNIPSFFKRMPPERVIEGWVAEAVTKAGNCVKCGECEEKCPYGLEIREVISQNVELFDRMEAEYLSR